MSDRETNTAQIKMVLALAHFEDMVRRHACGDRSGTAVEAARAAVLALAAPAAQGAQEPVAWLIVHKGYYREKEPTHDRNRADLARHLGHSVTPLYAAPVGQAEDAARRLEEFGHVLQRVGTLLDLPAGSDVTKDILPALHALKDSATSQWRAIDSLTEPQQVILAIRTSDSKWEISACYVDDSGFVTDAEYGDPTGWELEDYDAWMPMPAPPKADRFRVAVSLSESDRTGLVAAVAHPSERPPALPTASPAEARTDESAERPAERPQS